MGFLKGSATCQRFDVAGGLLAEAGNLDEVIGRLPRRGFTSPLTGETGEYPHYNWCGGRDIKDGTFEAERLVRGPFLCFAMLVTRQVIPQPEVAARAREELESLALDRPPRPQDRRAAATAALEALKEEGRKSGRWLKPAMVPVVYDSDRRQLWLHSASHTVADGFAALVADTFGTEISPVEPKAFAAEPPAGGVPEWLGDEEAVNGWGNRFALAVVERANDAAVPSDVSFDWPTGVMNPRPQVVRLIPRRTLTMRCPQGVKGLDRFDHDVPYLVPELAEALRAGKVPTSLGFDIQLDPSDPPLPFSFVPHRLTVSGLRVPRGEAKGKAEGELERLELTRRVLDAIDGCVREYVRERTQ